MDNSGAIIGPLVAAILLFIFPLNYKNVFIFATIPSIIGVLTIIFFIKDIHKTPKKSSGKMALKQLPKKFYAFLFIIFIFTLGNSTDALLMYPHKKFEATL